MKRITKDESLAQKEKIEKDKRLKKEKDRDEYLERLVAQRKFQEYVIDGILQKHINALTDTNKLFPKGFDIYKQKEEVAELISIGMATQKQLKAILRDLLN